MGLDQRGDISIAVIVFYVPILVVSFLLTLRHGFGRQAGWIFLLTFSIIRIVGGALHIAAELKRPVEIGLYIAAFSLESAGIAPLLLCTTSFLGVIGAICVQYVPIANARVFRLARILVTVGFALAIAGASEAAATDTATINQSQTLRRVGSIILIAVFAGLCVIQFMFWGVAERIRREHVSKFTMLVGATCAVPFLTVRLIYTVLSAFSPHANFSSIASGNFKPTGLERFNSITGDWQIFLVMSLLMEFIVVIIYLGFGLWLPLGEHAEELKIEQTEMSRSEYGNGRGYN